MEDVASVKNGKLYIVVTKDDGIVFKRVFNFADEEGKLLLVSDNRQYNPYTVASDEILEIWTAKAFFSNQFPENLGNQSVSDQLALQLVKLQEQMGKKKK